MLSLPAGRHVLKFTMSAPLGYYVNLVSTTEFTFGNEEKVMAKLTEVTDHKRVNSKPLRLPDIRLMYDTRFYRRVCGTRTPPTASSQTCVNACKRSTTLRPSPKPGTLLKNLTVLIEMRSRHRGRDTTRYERLLSSRSLTSFSDVLLMTVAS